MSTDPARVRGKRLALALGTLAALALAFSLWRPRPAAEPVALRDDERGRVADDVTRRLAPRGLSLPERDAPPGAGFRRRTVAPDEVARAVGVQILAPMEYDAQRIYRYRPHVREVVDWPEHPEGRWTRVTNGEGAREDHEFADPPPDDFVLVAGDSHTDGVCENARSYPNLIEDALARRRPGRSVEVYNTGVSGYSFYNHLGVLEANLARRPDVFVTTFFGGNDFVETVRIQHLFEGTVPPPRSPAYARQLATAAEFSPTAMTQGLNQLLYFREHPDQTDVALRAAVRATSEMQRLCAEIDCAWIAVYLPSELDLPSPAWSDLRARAKAALGLADADFEIGNRLGDRLIVALRERGIAVLDLRPPFRAQTERIYWKDQHIDLRGQRVVAEALLPEIAARLR